MQSSQLKTALQESPENITLRLMYLKALWDEHNYKDLYEASKIGLEFSPNNNELKLFMAKGAYYTSKIDLAEIVLEELRAQDIAEAYLWSAKCAFSNGEKSKALTYYSLAQKKDDNLQDDELQELLDGAIAVDDEDVKTNDSDFEFELPKINFSDVGGMERVKKDIHIKIILPLKQPELLTAYGKQAGGGILLYGPPGCGKTFIARAAAGEANVQFMAIGIHEVLNMWLGESERNLNNIFEQARRRKPCIVFFDEIDAIGVNRSHIKGGAGKTLVNQFLSELDGVEKSNENLLIIGATNTPWDLDAAFRRPGRFDKMIFVPPPDQKARKEILELLIVGRPIGKINLDVIAKKTEHFSGADLKGLINHTVEQKLEKAMESGQVELITQDDLLRALKEVKPSTLEWFATAKNYALYSNQGGQFDAINDFLKGKR